MKNISKRILSLVAVVFILMATMVPAFAANTCDASNKENCGANDQVCKTLHAMYGCIDYSTDKGEMDKYPYGITVSSGSGTSTPVYLESRPDVNDVSVSVDGSGRLNIYGMGTGDANTWNQFFAKYKTVIVGISGIGAITFIALFIFQFMKLGASAGNPQARSQALTGCLWTGIAAAALGAVSIIAGFFYNAV